MFKILLVEDDKELNHTVCAFLNKNGYEAIGALGAEEGFDKLFENKIDLIISDIMMPDIDGYEFAKEIRADNKEIPILFLTARDDFESKRKGFSLGIDDYMTKPVDLNEMLLHIEALFRRAKIYSSKKLIIGEFEMDADEHSAYLSGEEIAFTVREFDILYKLLSYPKKTFTRGVLMEEFWDTESESGPRVVDVYMTKIRDKISACDRIEIQTVHGLGYKAVIKDE